MKIHSHDDEQVSLSSILQETQTELKFMQNKNVFENMRFITKEELIHLIE